MRAVFLDTVGLLATWDEADQWHSAAYPVFQKILRDRRVVMTTTAVLLECGNAAARTTYREDVIALKNHLDRNQLLIPVTDEDWQSAWQAYERGGRGTAGIVDLVSFSAMRRIGLTEVFTNDQHFRTTGFTTLF